MLIEAQFAAGSDNAVQFGDGSDEIVDRAEHQRSDCAIDAAVLKR